MMPKAQPVGRLALLASALVFALCACQQKMSEQGRLKPFEPSPFFPDGASARQPVAGTVARGQFDPNSAYAQGKEKGGLVQNIPVPITRPLLQRGQERYNIYCAPCHSRIGDGQGVIPSRGFVSPPSFHSDRLRSAPAGHFFEVINQGYGAMFSYADRVPVADRWAIIAYIRALQLSQHAPLQTLTPDDRAKLEREAGP